MPDSLSQVHTGPAPGLRTHTDLSGTAAQRPAAVGWSRPVTTTPASSRSTFAEWSMRYTVRLMIFDGLVGVLAVLAAFNGFSVVPRFDFWKGAVLALGAGAAWPVAVAVGRGYERTKIGVGGDEMRAVLRAVVLGIAAGAVPSAITGSYGVVAVCTVATPLAGVGSLALRFAARKHLHLQQRQGKNIRKVILVGSAYAAADLHTVLSREPHAGMRVLGACVPRSDIARAQAAGLVVIGDLEQVPDLIRAYGADAVAVTGGDATRHSYLRELSWALEGAGVELLVHPGLIEVAGPRMHIRPYVGLPLLHVEQPHFTGWRRLLKRATDLVLTALGLLVISPALAVIALAIKLGDGGPVVFRQTRVGLDGSTFTMLKFRSMHIDAEARLAELRANHPHIGLMFKMEDDPRITRVGKLLRKFSLDELPQLLNVLRGSMSLVGPRPPLQSEVDTYEDHARRRLLVTPGLTGLWQVSGRSLLSWEETVRLDLRYVENWTLTLDLLILWKTFFAVVAKRGAF
jgi:exopolysaccharide biosynthesis polyprenyl glycosylphosphotransferase